MPTEDENCLVIIHEHLGLQLIKALPCVVHVNSYRFLGFQKFEEIQHSQVF